MCCYNFSLNWKFLYNMVVYKINTDISYWTCWCVVSLSIVKPVEQVKIQIASENTQQYYIPKHQKVIYYLTAFLIPVLFVLFYVQLDDN